MARTTEFVENLVTVIETLEGKGKACEGTVQMIMLFVTMLICVAATEPKRTVKDAEDVPKLDPVMVVRGKAALGPPLGKTEVMIGARILVNVGWTEPKRAGTLKSVKDTRWTSTAGVPPDTAREQTISVSVALEMTQDDEPIITDMSAASAGKENSDPESRLNPVRVRVTLQEEQAPPAIGEIEEITGVVMYLNEVATGTVIP